MLGSLIRKGLIEQDQDDWYMTPKGYHLAQIVAREPDAPPHAQFNQDLTTGRVSIPRFDQALADDKEVERG